MDDRVLCISACAVVQPLRAANLDDYYVQAIEPYPIHGQWVQIERLLHFRQDHRYLTGFSTAKTARF